MITTTDQINKAARTVKNKKPPGSDQITSKVVKLGGNSMVKILKRIFQKILSIEDTPSHFSKTLVTSVYMIGDSCKGENYIAMALLSILRKVFNRVILEKI